MANIPDLADKYLLVLEEAIDTGVDTLSLIHISEPTRPY